MQPSPKVGPTILGFFALPFLFGGLTILFAVINADQGNFHGNPLVGAVIAGLLLFIGGAIIAGAIFAYGGLKDQAARHEANPTSPWMWRKDWANRRAESSNKNSELLYWILCIFVNGITVPILISVFPALAQAGQPQAFVPLAFGLAGAGLLVQAVRVSLRQRRFGKTYFELNALPFSPGERVSGNIQLKMDVRAEHGIDLRLVCLRRTVTNSGNHSTTNEQILWEGDQNVPGGALAPGPMGRAIPVDFAIPADAYVTDQDNTQDQVIWRLFAQADVPGVDYKDSFELPVFKTSSASQPAGGFDAAKYSVNDQDSFASTNTSNPDSQAVPKPSKVKMRISPQAGGTEFYFRPLRNPASALILLVMTAFWTGVVYFLFHSNAPKFFGVIFGLCDILLVLGVFHAFFGSARIVVGNGEIVASGGILGLGKTRRIRGTDVEAIVPVASMQQGNTAGNTMYAIRLRTKDGRKFALADAIDSRQEARWIVAQMETLAGLKIDTHVETDSPFGAPPQPGQPANQQTWARPVWGSATPRNNSYVPVIAFFVLMAGMFAFMIFRATAFRARANNGARNATANRKTTRANSFARRTFSAPMTDADESRILGLQVQAQAEELLERSILHDTRALDLLEKLVNGWAGELTSTDKMKELERRSEFSKDLRVRYANADINLALQGWQKNETSAEQLIQRAETDNANRAWAVFYLGMIAGRGVEYDRIHSILLGYAKSDPDASVRQWAVEGMRYLEKDEVLDELFESFTQDSATAVRERAGCNISDCGNFTRKQRMRMTPQLIDLAANPSTNAQMKGWCFMALREITDANVPADAEAWKNWYVAHGAEKMAEFEKMDWWKVRGDE
jgi:hypothetical protein